MLRKMLKFGLKVSKSKKYIKWLKGKDRSKEFHHIVGRKSNDYLGLLLTRQEHTERHRQPNLYFERDLLASIENLIDYTQSLEKKRGNDSIASPRNNNYKLKDTCL